MIKHSTYSRLFLPLARNTSQILTENLLLIEMHAKLTGHIKVRNPLVILYNYSCYTSIAPSELKRNIICPGDIRNRCLTSTR